ncbi:hypothetical protein GQ53DRAFT_734493 [Thozetella sp. PMI_491]|nr:hypothetical protein GQ53DRAFT_734493 [Thozetella sp. PMI_491]
MHALASTPIRTPQTQICSWARLYVLALHLVIVVLLALFGSCSKRTLSLPSTLERTWSPVQEFIEFEINGEHALDHNRYSPYSGPPTPDQERAWDDLIKPVYFRASREELERGGERLDNLAELEGGGYLATIGVYHEIHCLRQLRLQLFRDRYYPNLTEAQDKYLHRHLDHCLEALRLTIMCNGNTALYSFAWDDPDAHMPATKSNSKSVCVKWSAVETWSHSRMVDSNPPLVRLSGDQGQLS